MALPRGLPLCFIVDDRRRNGVFLTTKAGLIDHDVHQAAFQFENKILRFVIELI